MVLMRYDRELDDVFRTSGFPNNLKVQHVVKLVTHVCYIPMIKSLVMLRRELLLFS